MDNLPKDPQDENNSNNPTPASPASPRGEPIGGPPPFGSSFTPVPQGQALLNPHSNPVDPNNPYQTQPPPQNPPSPNIPEHPDFPDPSKHATYSEIAQHKLRDAYGRFVHSEHLANTTPNTLNSPNPQTTSTSQLPPNPSSLSNPPPTPKQPNIFKRTFDLLSSIKWKKMTLYITGAATFIYLIISNPAFQNLVNHYFPNSSPILGRAVSFQGVLKSSQSGIFSLVLPDQQTYTIHFKPSAGLTNLKKLNEVVVKGNLTWTPYVIENAEIYPLNLTTDNTSKILSEVEGPNSPNLPNIPNQELLPKLYSDIKWEVTQKKVLLFTSGKRRIEQEGVYLESAQVTDLPQAFLDYYTNQLTNLGFKQTLNSSDPNGTTITYSKDDLFLTFGVKNIYSGSGDNKKIIGYKAFIEHN